MNLRQLLASRVGKQADFSQLMHALTPHGKQIADQSLIKDIIPRDDIEWWDKVYDKSLVNSEAMRKIQRQILISGAVNIFEQSGMRELMVDPATRRLHPELYTHPSVLHGIIEKRALQFIDLVPWHTFDEYELLYYIQFALACGFVRLAEYMMKDMKSISLEQYFQARKESSPLIYLDVEHVTFEGIIQNGHLNVIRFFHEKVAPARMGTDHVDVNYYSESFEKHVVQLCVEYDQPAILKYACESIGFRPDLLSLRLMFTKGPQNQCYQYLRTLPDVDEWINEQLDQDTSFFLLYALIEGGHDDLVMQTQLPHNDVLTIIQPQLLTSAIASNSLSMFKIILSWFPPSQLNFPLILERMTKTNRRGTTEMLDYCREMRMDDRDAYTDEMLSVIGDRQNVAMLRDYVYTYCQRYQIRPDLPYFLSMYDDEDGHEWCMIGALFAHDRDVLNPDFVSKCVQQEWLDVLKVVLDQRLRSDLFDGDTKKRLYALAADANNMQLMKMLHTHPFTKLSSGEIHGSTTVVGALATSSIAMREFVLSE